MEVIKYQHACFAVVKNGIRIVVDPGAWTHDFEPDDSVAAVVISHGHADHYDDGLMAAILESSPEVIVYAPSDVAKRHPNVPITTIESDKTVHVGDFVIRFVGGAHAAIDDSVRTPQNFGVLIDESLYYPGDSFILPPTPVAILALPVAAPWMKFSEAAAFLREVRPTQVFPTHDAILSDEGKELADTMFGALSKELGVTYGRL